MDFSSSSTKHFDNELGLSVEYKLCGYMFLDGYLHPIYAFNTIVKPIVICLLGYNALSAVSISVKMYNDLLNLNMKDLLETVVKTENTKHRIWNVYAQEQGKVSKIEHDRYLGEAFLEPMSDKFLIKENMYIAAFNHCKNTIGDQELIRTLDSITIDFLKTGYRSMVHGINISDGFVTFNAYRISKEKLQTISEWLPKLVNGYLKDFPVPAKNSSLMSSLENSNGYINISEQNKSLTIKEVRTEFAKLASELNSIEVKQEIIISGLNEPIPMSKEVRVNRLKDLLKDIKIKLAEIKDVNETNYGLPEEYTIIESQRDKVVNSSKEIRENFEKIKDLLVEIER